MFGLNGAVASGGSASGVIGFNFLSGKVEKKWNNFWLSG